MQTLPHDNEAEQVLPSDPEAAKALVGCLLLNDGKALPDFRRAHPNWRSLIYDEGLISIIEAAFELIDADAICEPIALCPKVKAQLYLKNHGGIQFLASLIANAPSSSHCNHYAGILLEKHLVREQLEAAADIQRYIRDGDLDGAAFAAKRALDAAVGKTVDDGLPEIENAADLLACQVPEPRPIIHDLLHAASKMVLGGSSKSFKTWTLIYLAMAVANGQPFWRLRTEKGRVLYLNFEVQREFFRTRLQKVAQALNLPFESSFLDVWNLRGKATDYRNLFPRIERRIIGNGYALVILDPIYKLLGGADENSATAMAAFMNAVELLAVKTGAAVVFGSHFAKGNASSKESIDRMSGSGVFARDPDSILTLTKHETDDAFTVECTLRNFKPLAPFAVRWLHPLLRRDDDLDPSRLKEAGGRKAEYTPEDVLAMLPKRGLETAAWQKRCDNENGVSKRTFYRLYKSLKESDRIRELDGKWQAVPQVPKPHLAP